MRFNEVSRRCVNKHKGAFNWYTLEKDLYFISDEVLYYLAHVYLHHPYINNTLEGAFKPPGYSHTIYPNYQNREAKRYDMHVDTVFEKLYGF
ncbi:hypothetical protein [Hymenobacter wooponensis]|uniref:Uncharacterized protein n=1 Tax=Hymenobacter wooponensis TaxID=1525360 RepID=A0A4Z0MN32_9BACT|nr:hypothetical protein [Hymenobacter wooponensis]TGD80820.1 hypothetical protein EU557_13535 [Hymenobacter wooponensis]